VHLDGFYYKKDIADFSRSV